MLVLSHCLIVHGYAGFWMSVIDYPYFLVIDTLIFLCLHDQSSISVCASVLRFFCGRTFHWEMIYCSICRKTNKYNILHKTPAD